MFKIYWYVSNLVQFGAMQNSDYLMKDTSTKKNSFYGVMLHENIVTVKL
jgi:hypothetical protein